MNYHDAVSSAFTSVVTQIGTGRDSQHAFIERVEVSKLPEIKWKLFSKTPKPSEDGNLKQNSQDHGVLACGKELGPELHM